MRLEPFVIYYGLFFLNPSPFTSIWNKAKSNFSYLTIYQTAIATKSRMKSQRLDKQTLWIKNYTSIVKESRGEKRWCVAFFPPTDCYSSIIVYYMYIILLSLFSSEMVAIVATALGESRDHCSIQERKIHNLHIIYTSTVIIIITLCAEVFFFCFV